MEDEQIIQLFTQCSGQAVSELSNKYGRVCTQVARNILSDPRDAEECINDAYLAVWNTIPPQNPHPLLSYVCRIVRNLALKKYHSLTAQKRDSTYHIALDELKNCLSSPDTAGNLLEARELVKGLNCFLGTLEQKNRIIFVRRYWYADAIGDIARKMGMTRHNVTVRLSRIRERLKKYLEGEGLLP